jgi:hypothetical protein
MSSTPENRHSLAASAQSLLEEIRNLEGRLCSMGEDGDCAYERAISRLYGALLKKRKEELAALRANGL